MEQSIKTIRALKVALPIAFVAFLLVIVAFYSRRAQPEADDRAETLERPEREGERPRLISYEFEDTQTVGDRVISRIRAAKTVGFDSGWYTLDRVELDIFREDGGVYTLSAPSAEFNAETKEARAQGGVIVKSGDGLDLRTESIMFDGRSLTNRIPVHFRMNSWSGTARGADLDVENETLTLNKGVDVSFDGKGPETIQLTAESAKFDRKTGTAAFRPDARMVRGADTYESRHLKAQVDQNRERLIGLEGWIDVVVRLAPGSDLAGVSGRSPVERRRIRADRFVGKFDGDGQLTAVEMFGGKDPVTVELTGEEARTARARSARVNLAQGFVESLELYGNVALEEQTELERSMGAERLVVTFDRSGQATTAVFDGDVRYRDVSNEAQSERMFYDLREETVKLSSVPSAAPTISSGPQRVSAEEIVVEPSGRVMRANGRVITRISNTGGDASATDTTLFPQNEAIFVNSDTLVIRELDGFAAFGGEVRAWQGNNMLFADSLQIQSGGETIDAKGNVRSILQNTREPDGEPMRSQSERLEARRAENQIKLIEEVLIETGGRTLAADEALFEFGPDQDLDRVIATGNLELSEAASGRSGSGEKAVYTLAEDKILIEGSPAEIREPRGAVRGKQIVLDMKRNRVDVLQGDSPTEATYNAEPGVR